MAKEKWINKICINCGTRNMKAALYPGSDIPIYYECKECGDFINDTEKYDRIYEENYEDIIDLFHEKFIKNKTEDEKKEMLNDILNNSTGGNTGGNTKNYRGALILEPKIVSFFETLSEYHHYTDMYGDRVGNYRNKTYWARPAKPPIMSLEKYDLAVKEVGKFADNQGLSEKQNKARKIVKENQTEKIKANLKTLYEDVFDEELTVYGKHIEKHYIKDHNIPTQNKSYQIIFSYPELEIIKMGKCW